MGLSLVACSSDKPESKKEEAKVAEKKKEEKRKTQQKSHKLTISQFVTIFLLSCIEYYLVTMDSLDLYHTLHEILNPNQNHGNCRLNEYDHIS